VLLFVCYLRSRGCPIPLLIAAGGSLFLFGVVLRPMRAPHDEVERFISSYWPLPYLVFLCVFSSCEERPSTYFVLGIITTFPCMLASIVPRRWKKNPIVNRICLGSIVVGSMATTARALPHAGLIASVGICLWGPATCALALIYLRQDIEAGEKDLQDPRVNSSRT